MNPEPTENVQQETAGTDAPTFCDHEDECRGDCETLGVCTREAPDAPPREPSIRIEIPIAYLSSVAIDDEVGPEIYFDPDASPKNWDAASLPVPLATAIRAAEMLEAARENRTQTSTVGRGGDADTSADTEVRPTPLAPLWLHLAPDPAALPRGARRGSHCGRRPQTRQR